MKKQLNVRKSNQMKCDLTQSELKSHLLYEPNTGNFFRFGKSLGSVKPDGYIYIDVLGVRYLAHRLVWLYVHGRFPDDIIDHINQDKLDNRICNLRESNKQLNARNSKLRYDSKSGVTGVTLYHHDNSKWSASIKVNYRNICLGVFDSLTEAVAHRLAAEQCLDWCNPNSTAKAYMEGYLNANKYS